MLKNFLILSLILSFSCNNTTGLTPKQLKTGTFKTVLDDGETTSIVYRNDSTQIEIYDNKKYTYAIHWKSNFEYILKSKNPKNALDSTDFIIKITGIHKNSYTFKANYKGSNYIQEGHTFKIDTLTATSKNLNKKQ